MRFKLFFNFILLTFFAFSQISVSVAQKKPNRAKHIETIKFGFVAGRLNLTADESSAFWPLYKDYQTAFYSLLKQKKQSRLANANNPEKAVDDDFSYDSKILALKKDYRKAFGKVLPPEKIKMLYQAERDFREELIKQLKNRSREED